MCTVGIPLTVGVVNCETTVESMDGGIVDNTEGSVEEGVVTDNDAVVATNG